MTTYVSTPHVVVVVSVNIFLFIPWYDGNAGNAGLLLQIVLTNDAEE